MELFSHSMIIISISHMLTIILCIVLTSCGIITFKSSDAILSVPADQLFLIFFNSKDRFVNGRIVLIYYDIFFYRVILENNFVTSSKQILEVVFPHFGYFMRFTNEISLLISTCDCVILHYVVVNGVA